MSLSDDDVLEILKIIDGSDFGEFELEIGDLRLVVRKSGYGKFVPEPNLSTKDQTGSLAPRGTDISLKKQGAITNESVLLEVAEKREERHLNDLLEEKGLIPVRAPLMGIFYSAPNPGDLPFVEVGKHVEESSTVCLIEVMKVYSHVKAGTRGQIVKVLAKNAEMVEYNQTLFLIKPDESSKGDSVV